MDQTVAIVTPAFAAQSTIVPTVRSVLAQTYPHWELWLVADDGFNYEALLAAAGIVDRRIHFAESGGVGRGVCHTRNVALDLSQTPFAATLDADDRFKPRKLELAVAALADHSIVSTALDVMSEDFTHLRHVGHGDNQVLTSGTHKWVNLSMDSMIVWDRRRADGRYDPAMRNMNDLEFLLQLFRTVPTSSHLGTPLHDYVKRSQSLSNGGDVTARMIASKTEILRRLDTGHYGLPAEEAEGVAAFLQISLEAEARYGAALTEQPNLLFEDHLEPMLARAKQLA